MTAPVVVQWRLLDSGPVEDQLSSAVVRHIADQIATSGALVLELDGREPLRHPAAGDVVRRCAQQGMLVSVSTEGRQDLASCSMERLMGSGLYSVVLRLLHPKAHDHDLLSGSRGSFDYLHQLASVLAQRDCRCVLGLTMAAPNLDHVREAAEVARVWGVSGFTVSPVVSSDKLGVSEWTHEWTKIFEWLRGKDATAILSPAVWVGNKHFGPHTESGCSAHRRLAKISPSGTLLVCGGSDLGIDLTQVPFHHAWDRFLGRASRPEGSTARVTDRDQERL